VDAISADRAWAVGVGGTILGFDGRSWSRMASPSQAQLSDVSAISETDVWAVGWEGTVLHFDGTTWRRLSPPFDMHYNTVDANARDEVWIGGVEPPFFRYDGETWVRQSITPPTVISGIDAIEMVGGRGWAINGLGVNLAYERGEWRPAARLDVRHLSDLAFDGDAGLIGGGGCEFEGGGCHGQLFALRSGRWEEIESPGGTEPIIAVSRIADTDWVMATHGPATFAYWRRDGAWQDSPVGVMHGYDMDFYSASEGWIVGSDGRIFRRSGPLTTPTVEPSPEPPTSTPMPTATRPAITGTPTGSTSPALLPLLLRSSGLNPTPTG
jgi:hypothetical protein